MRGLDRVKLGVVLDRAISYHGFVVVVCFDYCIVYGILFIVHTKLFGDDNVIFWRERVLAGRSLFCTAGKCDACCPQPARKGIPLFP